MKKLKNKVFIVIYIILTLFLLSILMISNYQTYQQKANDVKSNLMRMDNEKNKKFDRKPDDMIDIDVSNEKGQRPIFMDTIVYAVTLDENMNITDVVNHTTNSVTDDEIKDIAENIIKNKTTNIKIGNLYIEKYSYSFNKDNTSLIIIDNTQTNAMLLKTLETSILIFIVLEVVIIFISVKLTSWIIKPVIETFNKQKQFIEDASHELKTPLSVIMACSEALENESEEKKWLSNIKSESERMNKLISNLLDMAKSENQNNEQFAIEDFSKLIEKSVLTFESLIYEKNINLEYDIEENINTKCDGDQIKQLVGILIDNAIKHSSIKGKIKVKLKKEKGNIVLTVTNKGEEIAKEDREKIFERFYRTDKSRNRNENRYGLGLAIAKNIVTNHNGEISADSENGYTTFKVVIKEQK